MAANVGIFYLARGPAIVPDVFLSLDVYQRQESAQFPPLKLGLTLWDGVLEGKRDTWLRWVDQDGRMISGPRVTANNSPGTRG